MKKYKPPFYLNSPHVQTILAGILKRFPKLKTRKEPLATPDGDELDLRWLGERNEKPLIVLLHGLEGSIDSSYIRGMFFLLEQKGYQTVLMHFRNCGDTPNKLTRRLYHSGETEDLNYLIHTLSTRYPQRKICVIGYSLGGNVLLKWLGEKQKKRNVSKAIAVSVPFDLMACEKKLRKGLGRIYAKYYLSKLRSAMRRKYTKETAPFDWHKLGKLKTLGEFDDLVTAPIHGFQDAQDYYEKSSSRQFIPQIKIPTTILQAMDDPILFKESLPTAKEIPNSVKLELSPKGGHVGFIFGSPWKLKFFLEKRILEVLEEI